MKTVFADTGYWIALIDCKDQLHEQAEAFAAEDESLRIVTSEMVLVEFLTSMNRQRKRLRKRASEMVMSLTQNPSVYIVPQTSEQFQSALEFYAARLDKQWSLTDCASFLIMEHQNINEALAHDRNFEQAGFRALLREDLRPEPEQNRQKVQYGR